MTHVSYEMTLNLQRLKEIDNYYNFLRDRVIFKNISVEMAFVF